MVRVSEEVLLPARASRVWDRVGVFNNVHAWHPAIAESRLEDGGTVRRVRLAGGDEAVERLVARDDAGRCYTYALVEGDMPVSEYLATIAVSEDRNGTARVRWASEFTPADTDEAGAAAAIRRFLRQGLANLERMYQTAHW